MRWLQNDLVTISINMQWPVYKKELLITGDIDSPVAICTLWTQRKLIASAINSDIFSVIGNLYSTKRGLDFLVRNLLANPKIYYLIVCGTDGSGSGQALIDFFTKGVIKGINKQGSHCWLVKGNNNGEIDIEVPEDALRILRKNVKVFDLRNISDSKKIVALGKTKNFSKKRSGDYSISFREWGLCYSWQNYCRMLATDFKRNYNFWGSW